MSQVVLDICDIHGFLLISQTLTTLNLIDNEIGAVGAQDLSEALRHNTVSKRVLKIYLILVFLTISPDTHCTQPQLQ